MPKKNGVTKTYSFSKSTVDMMNEICEDEHRSQTNLIEVLIEEKHSLLLKKRKRSGV